MFTTDQINISIKFIIFKIIILIHKFKDHNSQHIFNVKKKKKQSSWKKIIKILKKLADNYMTKNYLVMNFITCTQTNISTIS